MKKAFTIIEVLVVVIIIGILASIAIPQYTKVLLKARTAEAMTNLGALRGAMDRYWYQEIAMGGYEDDCQLRTGENDDERGREFELDIENPNNIDPNHRDWAYGILDLAGMVPEGRPLYILEAMMLAPDGERILERWIQMNQDGMVSKACELGGDDGFLPGADGHIPW